MGFFPLMRERRRVLDSPLPRAVRYAVWLMRLGAALEIVSAVTAVTTEGGFQAQIAVRSPKLGSAMLHSIAVAHVQALAVECAIACVVWLLLASVNQRARNEIPRIVSVIFFILSIGGLQNSFRTVNTAPSLVVDVIIWIVGLAAIMLLFEKMLLKIIGRHEPGQPEAGE